MIKSDLIKINDELGSKVELKANSTKTVEQMLQFELELLAIFSGLSEKFTSDGAILIITNTIDKFIEAHKPA